MPPKPIYIVPSKVNKNRLYIVCIVQSMFAFYFHNWANIIWFLFYLISLTEQKNLYWSNRFINSIHCQCLPPPLPKKGKHNEKANHSTVLKMSKNIARPDMGNAMRVIFIVLTRTFRITGYVICLNCSCFGVCVCKFRLPDCLKWECESSDDFPMPTFAFVNVFVV